MECVLMSSGVEPAPVRGLWRAVLTLTFARLVVNMTRRFTYAFVPGIARELSVAESAVQATISAQSGVALASPLLGGFAERYGRKSVILAALMAVIAVALVGALMPIYGVFFGVMIGFGIAKMLVDPALLAYIGDRVPYSQRSAAIGVTELSWAGALLVVAPLTGLLLERATLSAVFLALAIGALLGALAIWRFLPSDRPEGEVKRVSLREVFHALRRSPTAVAVVLVAMFTSASNEIVFINYGVFMERSFGLALSALGFVTISISIAEVVGELVVVGLGDRIGPKRLTLIGLGCAAAAYAVLPFLGFDLSAAVVGVVVMFLAFEVSVVASIPLSTEALPGARAPMIAATISGVALGRLGGGLLGGLSYALSGGFVVGGVLASGSALMAFWVLWRRVHVTG
jgi:predicted MFS family arabinose efflux permease